MIVIMNPDDNTLLRSVVRLKQQIERRVLLAEIGGTDREKTELMSKLKNIKNVLAVTCRHNIVVDEIECIRGLEPHLQRVRYCAICELSDVECAL